MTNYLYNSRGAVNVAKNIDGDDIKKCFFVLLKILHEFQLGAGLKENYEFTDYINKAHDHYKKTNNIIESLKIVSYAGKGRGGDGTMDSKMFFIAENIDLCLASPTYICWVLDDIKEMLEYIRTYCPDKSVVDTILEHGFDIEQNIKMNRERDF